MKTWEALETSVKNSGHSKQLAIGQVIRRICPDNLTHVEVSSNIKRCDLWVIVGGGARQTHTLRLLHFSSMKTRRLTSRHSISYLDICENTAREYAYTQPYSTSAHTKLTAERRYYRARRSVQWSSSEISKKYIFHPSTLSPIHLPKCCWLIIRCCLLWIFKRMYSK